MALGRHPAFLASAVTVGTTASHSKAAARPQVLQSSAWPQIPFTMQAQTQSNWCWAATATTTSLYYLAGSSWTQCGVADAALPRSDCCSWPVPTPCNVPWYLDTALGVTGNFVSMTGTLTISQVVSELQAGRPLGARVGWSGGGGHFMVISGYSKVMGVDRYMIEDPIYGRNGITTFGFQNGSYQGSGSWTHSYYTQA